MRLASRRTRSLASRTRLALDESRDDARTTRRGSRRTRAFDASTRLSSRRTTRAASPTRLGSSRTRIASSETRVAPRGTRDASGRTRFASGETRLSSKRKRSSAGRTRIGSDSHRAALLSSRASNDGRALCAGGRRRGRLRGRGRGATARERLEGLVRLTGLAPKPLHERRELGDDGSVLACETGVVAGHFFQAFGACVRRAPAFEAVESEDRFADASHAKRARLEGVGLSTVVCRHVSVARPATSP
jgi:hypothetical protein